jgi:hypothetical protein
MMHNLVAALCIKYAYEGCWFVYGAILFFLYESSQDSDVQFVLSSLAQELSNYVTTLLL